MPYVRIIGGAVKTASLNNRSVFLGWDAARRVCRQPMQAADTSTRDGRRTILRQGNEG